MWGVLPLIPVLHFSRYNYMYGDKCPLPSVVLDDGGKMLHFCVEETHWPKEGTREPSKRNTHRGRTSLLPPRFVVVVTEDAYKEKTPNIGYVDA